MNGFTSRAIHGGISSKDPHGALRTPVYDSVAFGHEDSESIQLTFEGNKPGHTYTRMSNPTVQDFEEKIRLLTGGKAVLSLSSGMAAISTTILALAEAGCNIVTCRHLFGNTVSLLERTFAPWGLEVRMVEMTDPAQVEAAIDEKTRAVFLESVTNPQLEVADCRAISRITAHHKVPLILDNTVTTPYLFNTKEAGVDIEILSATKFISGGATAVGGIIIDNGTYDWRLSPKLAVLAEEHGPMTLMVRLRREVSRNLGGCMNPHNAFLQSLGLETMGLRIDKSCSNALQVARYLEESSQVKTVHYPGLESSPFHGVAASQFSGSFGGILTFDLADQQACYSFMDSLTMIRRATNVNDNKSLIIHPFSTVYAEYSDQEKLAMGVRPSMLRLSVGIEEVDDIVGDLERGFAAV